MKFSILAISLLATFTAAELVQKKCFIQHQMCSELRPGNPPCCGDLTCQPSNLNGHCLPPGTWERMQAEAAEEKL